MKLTIASLTGAVLIGSILNALTMLLNKFLPFDTDLLGGLGIFLIFVLVFNSLGGEESEN